MKTWFRGLLAALFMTLAQASGFAAEPILVIGHKNPDSDAIVSAIAMARLKTALGEPAEARAQGEPNPETQFLLRRFGVTAPPVQHSVAGRRVILVDHSDVDLAPDDLQKGELVGLYDHHKLGGVTSDAPLEIIVKPWGSAATVIEDLYRQKGVAIEPPLAGLMLGAILSDTRVFRSPTTTPVDKAAAERLAKQAGVENIESFGRQLLDAYNDSMRAMSDEALLAIDMKAFRMGQRHVAISQIEAFDIAFLKPRLAGLRAAMEKLAKQDGFDAVILAVTDVDRRGSLILTAGAQAALARTGLNIAEEAPDGVWKDGVMSRKQQLVPPVQKAFAGP